TLVGLAPQEDREVAAGYKVQVRNPTKASSRSGKAKPRNFGCFMRERAANDAPRCTRARPKFGCASKSVCRLQPSGAKPGQGRSVLAVHSRTSPHRKPRRAAVCAAISHSTSVG